MDEREADIAFLSEVWEKKENKKHRKKLETMFEMRGIEYISTPVRVGKGEGEQLLLCQVIIFISQSLTSLSLHQLKSFGVC